MIPSTVLSLLSLDSLLDDNSVTTSLDDFRSLALLGWGLDLLIVTVAFSGCRFLATFLGRRLVLLAFALEFSTRSLLAALLRGGLGLGRSDGLICKEEFSLVKLCVPAVVQCK